MEGRGLPDRRARTPAMAGLRAVAALRPRRIRGASRTPVPGGRTNRENGADRRRFPRLPRRESKSATSPAPPQRPRDLDEAASEPRIARRRRSRAGSPPRRRSRWRALPARRRPIRTGTGASLGPGNGREIGRRGGGVPPEAPKLGLGDRQLRQLEQVDVDAILRD